MLLTQFNDTAVDDGIDVRRIMSTLVRVILAAEPLHDIEVGWAVEGDWVTVEQVGHHDEVAIGCELVGDELDVVELVADDVGDAVQGAMVSGALAENSYPQVAGRGAYIKTPYSLGSPTV
jgi:hypothetical protein